MFHNYKRMPVRLRLKEFIFTMIFSLAFSLIYSSFKHPVDDTCLISMDNQEKVTIHLIRKGDPSVFRKLYDVYYYRLFLYAKSYLDNENEAEDVVQELFIHLYEKRKELIVFSSLTSYFFRSVHNKCIQVLRHRKVIVDHEERHRFKIREAEILYNRAANFTFSEQQLKEIQQIFQRANEDLPDKTREIFRLSREQSKSNKEIAHILNIQLKTVEYHITKALKSFSTVLKDYFV